ncbi:hypothetical protein BKA63DRAFT_19398 [Paraphoma chrysanthemicola]|nr:hypothetical protein BKA63DRAFT_19398 [Paraphoma chrysanthemicola]
MFGTSPPPAIKGRTTKPGTENLFKGFMRGAQLTSLFSIPIYNHFDLSNGYPFVDLASPPRETDKPSPLLRGAPLGLGKTSRAGEDSIGMEIISIEVGEGVLKQTFTVHAALITSRSEYIIKQLNNQTTAQPITVNCVDPRAFALYVLLLYFNRLPSKSKFGDPDHDEHALLCKLYVLAVNIQDTPSKNTALSAIFTKCQEDDKLPLSEHIWSLYNGTSAPSLARSMMVDLSTFKATKEFLHEHGKDFPPEFLEELAISLLEHRAVPQDVMDPERVVTYHE